MCQHIILYFTMFNTDDLCYNALEHAIMYTRQSSAGNQEHYSKPEVVFFLVWRKLTTVKKTQFHEKIIYRVFHNSLRNFRTRLRNNQDRHSRKELLSTCKVGQELGISLPQLVDMLSFGVTIPATVSQESEIAEGLLITLYFGHSHKFFNTDCK
jgi:hypothetical protein